MSLQSPLLDERGLQSPLLDERADAPPAAAADGPTPPPPSARALAGLKLLFLLSSLSVATWGRLAAIFYHDRGLSPLEIGLIEGLMPLVQAGCQPCWGLLADARGARKPVFLATSSLATATLLALALVGRGFAPILAVSLAAKAFSSPGSPPSRRRG